MTNIEASKQALKARRIGRFNVIGFLTLSRREVQRFLNVYMQTIIAPAVTTLLFFTVFALAFGGAEREVAGMPFLEFLGPGLVMMGMAQNAFANTSSSLVISKVQGNIVDVLMPPLSSLELVMGFLCGAVLRGVIVGIVTVSVLGLFVHLPLYSLGRIAVFGLLGPMMLGLLGIIAGLWSDKFDHMAAFTNFVIMPLTFLSGTFYSIEALPGFWRDLGHFNPFFYMIDGFRSGFIGHADGDALIGALVLVVINAVLFLTAWLMIKTGYKIKS